MITDRRPTTVANACTYRQQAKSNSRIYFRSHKSPSSRFLAFFGFHVLLLWDTTKKWCPRWQKFDIWLELAFSPSRLWPKSPGFWPLPSRASGAGSTWYVVNVPLLFSSTGMRWIPASWTDSCQWSCATKQVGSGLLVVEVNINTMSELGSGSVSLVSATQP